MGNDHLRLPPHAPPWKNAAQRRKAPETTSSPTGPGTAPAIPGSAPDAGAAPEAAPIVLLGGGHAHVEVVRHLGGMRLSRPVTLVLELDDTPLSTELQGFIGEMVALSNGKLKSVAVDAAGVITAEDGSSAPTSLTVGEPLAVTLPDGAELPVYGSLDDSGRAQFDVAGVLPSARPVVRMCVPAENSDAGTLLFTGLAFHGVPSGHEFNSFVLGLYNAAGPGQPLDDDLKARAEAIDTPIDVMILVSLTCTMCPETVLAAQRIASLNPNVRAEAYDVAHFPELKDQYGAMSVPCIVINHPGGEQKVEFGKKSVPQMLTLLGA